MKSSIANGENRGSVNNILLKALQSGDKYGYEINKEIETKSKGKFYLKEASLYSGLKRLQANGYITSYWQDGELGIRRHYYSITEKGLEKLNSSNFAWDDSKDFISEMFKDSPITKINNDSIELENKIEDKKEETKENKDLNIKEDIKQEIKKNPFQIEVSPLQQSIFDISFSETIKEEKVENQIKENLINNENLKEENSESTSLNYNSYNGNEENTFNEKEETEANKEVNALENKEQTVNNKFSEKEYSQVSYQDILNNYSYISYSQSLTENNEKVDISKYLTKEKENDDNIIIENIKDNKSIQNSFENNKIEQVNLLKETEKLNEDNLNEKIEISKEKLDDKTEFLIEKENQESEKKSNVDIKNIFGSLLVDETQEEQVIDNTKNEDSEEIEEIEKPIKKDLPRINVDDDINITLNTNRTKNATPPIFRQEEVKISSVVNNTPSVKQYINNVHKKTLISRATTVEEEVNLEGINIREYRKMNNKVIKNSNYIYKNKLNLFLTLLFASILIFESVISLIVFNKSNCLGIFEVLLLSFLIISSLCFINYQTYIYFKDKFKVELKNYNFKNTLFYCCLIFIVIMIIFVCINIFEGMNSNNINEFIKKIFLEFIMSFNIVLLPIIKLWFYKLKNFTN